MHDSVFPAADTGLPSLTRRRLLLQGAPAVAASVAIPATAFPSASLNPLEELSSLLMQLSSEDRALIHTMIRRLGRSYGISPRADT